MKSPDYSISLPNDGEIVRVPYPKNPDGTHDKPAAKRMFFESQFLTWYPFCQSVGWDHKASRNWFPVSLWVEEKTKLYLEKHADEMSDTIFKSKESMTRRILNVLEKHPDTCERLHQVILAQIGIASANIKDNIESAQRNGRIPDLDKDTTYQLSSLAAALDTVIRAHHKSLLIESWDMKLVETFIEKAKETDKPVEVEDNRWVAEIIPTPGMEISYDPPQEKLDAPHTDSPVAAPGTDEPF